MTYAGAVGWMLNFFVEIAFVVVCAVGVMRIARRLTSSRRSVKRGGNSSD